MGEEIKAKAIVVDPKFQWLVDALLPKLKEFLKAQLVKLDEKVLASENKIDDVLWASLKVMIVSWIDGL